MVDNNYGFQKIIDTFTKLRATTSDADWQELLENLNAIEKPETANDEPPDFPGKPLVGGGKVGERQAPAMDARRRASNRASFEKEFPDAARIAMDDGYGRQPAPKAISSKSSVIAGYNEMFPGADQIKKI